MSRPRVGRRIRVELKASEGRTACLDKHSSPFNFHTARSRAFWHNAARCDFLLFSAETASKWAHFPVCLSPEGRIDPFGGSDLALRLWEDHWEASVASLTYTIGPPKGSTELAAFFAGALEDPPPLPSSFSVPQRKGRRARAAPY